MRRIAFSGTLDPITNGHMWVIGEARALADEVIVFLSENPFKKPQFSAELRKRVIEQSAALRGWDNVQVLVVKGDYTARAAKQHGIDYLIRATDHFQSASVEHPLKHVMLGVDLAILGQDAEVYDCYAAAIRAEYGHVAPALYQANRSKALQHLQAKALANQLYLDGYFAQQYRDKAVANMGRELAVLSAAEPVGTPRV